jgi:release factor glutamine methyltransferase
VNYYEVLKYGENILKKNNIASPEINSELLLCNVCNISRIDLRLKYYESIADELFEKIKNNLELRANNYPLQYLIGNVPFYNTNLIINNSVLIPRPETEFLVDIIVKKYAKKNIIPPKILDICTGSGCISLALGMLYKTSQIDGIDISEDAIEVANLNKDRLGIENVHFMIIDVNHLNDEQKLNNLDLIVCNPPYISLQDYNNLATELFYEPKIALTDFKDGLSFYKTISNSVDKLLSSEGELFFECGINQAKDIEKIFMDKGYKVEILQDFATIDRYIVIHK